MTAFGLVPLGDAVAVCRICGCTDAAACEGGCWWVRDPEGLGDVCSACVEGIGPWPDEALEGGSG